MPLVASRGDFVEADDELDGPDLVNPNLAIQTLSVPAGERYSFIFGGSAQALDHALTSTTLSAKVSGYEYGRGNADAPLIQLEDETTAARASDHDGFVLYLDVTPPTITVADPIILWPPNNNLEEIPVGDGIAALSDGLTAADVFVTSVSSDEPVVNPDDEDGEEKPDFDIVADECQTFQVRRTRFGERNGRVYEVNVAAEDTAGNVGTATFEGLGPQKGEFACGE